MLLSYFPNLKRTYILNEIMQKKILQSWKHEHMSNIRFPKSVFLFFFPKSTFENTGWNNFLQKIMQSIMCKFSSVVLSL